MVLHEINPASPPEIQQAIREFESTFLMPFAQGHTLRVDYGSDRAAFIRTLGDSQCLAAEKEGRIVGVIEMALVNLQFPSGEPHLTMYIADIKMAPDARGSIATARLLQQATAWGQARTNLCFTMVLDTAPLKPPAYTGRAGIPELSEAGRTNVVRLPTTPGDGIRAGEERFIGVGEEEGHAIFQRLSYGRYFILGGNPSARSEIQPTWLVHPRGTACARFEDRRKVRRLIADDGAELRPAYLSCFAFTDPEAAVDLILAALHRAESLGFRAIRFCAPPIDLSRLQCVVGPGVINGAGGSIFTNAPAACRAPWNLSASEV